MKISRISLANFRSYDTAGFDLHPETTLIVGPNASGKTNLLEALYVLATTKSFRAHDRDLVKRGEDFFRVTVNSDVGEYAIGLSVAPTLQKRVSKDGDRCSLAAHVGEIQVALFEPSHLDIVTGAPEGRRKYLDFILCQTDRGYLKTLQAYKRVLRQRNALLEPGRPVDRSQLFVWDLKLTELAMMIVGARMILIERLGRLLPELYASIAGQSVSLELKYLPSVDGEYGEQFLAALERNLSRDLAAGFTTVGPHREDWVVSFDGSAVSAVASRGETRTLVLALKLAEMDYLEQQSGQRPLLLLDDVFSELDHDRRLALLSALAGRQSIVTTTDADSVTHDIAADFSIIRTGGQA